MGVHLVVEVLARQVPPLGNHVVFRERALVPTMLLDAVSVSMCCFRNQARSQLEAIAVAGYVLWLLGYVHLDLLATIHAESVMLTQAAMLVRVDALSRRI